MHQAVGNILMFHTLLEVYNLAKRQILCKILFCKISVDKFSAVKKYTVSQNGKASASKLDRATVLYRAALSKSAHHRCHYLYSQ